MDDDPFRPRPSLNTWALEVHRQEQMRRAERARVAALASRAGPGLLRRLASRLVERRLPQAASASTPEVSLRAPRAEDRLGLLYLALRAGSEVVPGPLLVAELDGRVVAAASLSSDAVLSEGSPQASELVKLLRLRADQLRGHGIGQPRPA